MRAQVKLGRNFSRYQNPAYQNKKGGTLTLVREGQTIDHVAGVDNLAFENEHYKGPPDTDEDVEKGIKEENNDIAKKDREKEKKGTKSNDFKKENVSYELEDERKKLKSLTLDRNFNDIVIEDDKTEENTHKPKSLTVEKNFNDIVADNDQTDEIDKKKPKMKSLTLEKSFNDITGEDDQIDEAESRKPKSLTLEKNFNEIDDEDQIIEVKELKDAKLKKLTLEIERKLSDSDVKDTVIREYFNPQNQDNQFKETSYNNTNVEKLTPSIKEVNVGAEIDDNVIKDKSEAVMSKEAGLPSNDLTITDKTKMKSEEYNSDEKPKLLIEVAASMFEKVDPEKVKASREKNTHEDVVKKAEEVGFKENVKEPEGLNPFDEVETESDKVISDIVNATIPGARTNISQELHTDNKNLKKDIKKGEPAKELNPFDDEDETAEINQALSQIASSQNPFEDPQQSQGDMTVLSNMNDSKPNSKNKQSETLSSQTTGEESKSLKTKDIKILTEITKADPQVAETLSTNPFDEPDAVQLTNESKTKSSPKNDNKSETKTEKSQQKDSNKSGKGDSKKGQGDSKKGQGDSKKDQGESKKGQGDSKKGPGDSKKGQGNSKKGQGDSKKGQGNSEVELEVNKADRKGDKDPVNYSMDDIDAILMESYAIDESISNANKLTADEDEKGKKKSSKKKKSSIKDKEKNT